MKAYSLTDEVMLLPKYERKSIAQFMTYLEQRIAQTEPAPVEAEKLL